MSHTTPPPDNDSPAPGGSGNAYVRFFAWAMFALVLYVLSTGPAWWLVSHHHVERDTMRAFYFPLTCLPQELLHTLDEYALWWAPIRP